MLRQPRPLAWFTEPKRTYLFYLLDDEFITAQSAPLSSPRTCEPGPGTLTLVQNDGQFSIASDRLVMPAQSTPLVGDLGFYDAARTRKAGRTLVVSLQKGSGGSSYPFIGWHAANHLPDFQLEVPLGMAFGASTGANAFNATGPAFIGFFAINTTYVFFVVQRATGGFLFVKGDVFTQPTLLWVYNDGSASPLTALAFNYDRSGSLDYFRELDLPSPFDTDYAIATVHTSAVSGSDYSATANGIFDVAISAPGTLANTAGLKFRKSGGDYWKVNFDGSGNLILQRYASNVAQGSPVTLATGVIAASATRTLRVLCDGTSMDFYTQSGATWTKRGSTQTDSVLSANSGINPFADSGWSLGQVDAFPRTSGNYSILDNI